MGLKGVTISYTLGSIYLQEHLQEIVQAVAEFFSLDRGFGIASGRFSQIWFP